MQEAAPAEPPQPQPAAAAEAAEGPAEPHVQLRDVVRRTVRALHSFLQACCSADPAAPGYAAKLCRFTAAVLDAQQQACDAQACALRPRVLALVAEAVDELLPKAQPAARTAADEAAQQQYLAEAAEPAAAEAEQPAADEVQQVPVAEAEQQAQRLREFLLRGWRLAAELAAITEKARQMVQDLKRTSEAVAQLVAESQQAAAAAAAVQAAAATPAAAAVAEAQQAVVAAEAEQARRGQKRSGGCGSAQQR